MFKLNLKIALRNLWKNRGITAINIGGLAIALAAFILISMYVKYETTFDKTNENYDRIYLVGRNLVDYKTDYTPPPLKKLIAENCPEVELAGKVKKSSMEFAMMSDNATIYVKNLLAVDYDAAKMFGLNPVNGLERPSGDVERLGYLSDAYMKTLFPGKRNNGPEMVTMGSKNSGITAKITGSIVPDPHSIHQYDGLFVANELGANEGFGYPNYQTYIQVKKGTDIALLEKKIDKIYKEGAVKEGMEIEAEALKRPFIYLDKLADLHLKPAAGNDNAYKVVVALFVLGILVLVIACINFTNLSIAQANSRAREVGVKKVMGAYRTTLTLQFLGEIFFQCLLSTVIGLILAELLMPRFNNLFNVDLSLWTSTGLFWQLPLIVVIITTIAGIYPSIILSGFKPALVLKGNYQTSMQARWIRKGLLTVQFTVAVVFITCLLIISGQLNYMKSADVGFKAEQVIKIKNIAVFNDPKTFAPIREKMLKIQGIKSVTVGSVVPGGDEGGGNNYTAEGRDNLISFIDVDFDYFETLGIKLKAGRYFSPAFATDTANSAILNESAVAKYGLKDPIGKTIRGCSINYKIVGVIKDFKTQGFEHAVQPTIYAMKNPCGNYRLEILVKAEENKMAGVIAALRKDWAEINPKDGDNFRYEFLDELYGRLFVKQAQLQSVFFAAAGLTIFIAVLGLFAFAKFVTNNRRKEISVRKILGASNLQILRLLNSSFVWIVMISNVISWPIAFILAKKWLATFAYSVDISAIPFLIAAVCTIVLTLFTVSLQAVKTVKENPVSALKYE